MMNDYYLMHHGVKGMKWGVRHDRPSSGERRAARKAKHKRRASIIRNYTGGRSSDALKAARRQDINSMSNQELQQHVTRLNLERQYRSLTGVNFNAPKNYMKTGIETDTKVKTIMNRTGEYGRKIAMGAAYASGAPAPIHIR